jgi:hypothetical protein
MVPSSDTEVITSRVLRSIDFGYRINSEIYTLEKLDYIVAVSLNEEYPTNSAEMSEVTNTRFQMMFYRVHLAVKLNIQSKPWFVS